MNPISRLQAELDFWCKHVLDLIFIDENSVLANADRVSSLMEELDTEHNFMWDNPSDSVLAEGKASMVSICAHLRNVGVHVHMKRSYLELT